MATLLLVDDHAIVRAGIRNALQELEGIEIIGELGSGNELLNFLKTRRPDCLLIDLTMPDFEPISAISMVRNTYPEMKILVVSAYDDDVYVQGLLGLGVNGYHLKDQPLSDLRLAVQRVLTGERWVSGRIVDQLLKNNNSPLDQMQLTGRQREILRLLHKGYDNRNISLELNLSIKTVENHLTRMYRQMNVHSRLEAVNFLIQHPEILGLSSGDKLYSHEPARPFRRDSRTILVVDDNKRYRHQIIRIINSISPTATVYEAENTSEALIFAQRVSPQLAFVDVVLGNENGIHCVQKIRKASPSSRLILFSAYPDSEFHRLGLEAGAVAFLDKKNLDTHTLRQVLDDIGLL